MSYGSYAGSSSHSTILGPEPGMSSTFGARGGRSILLVAAMLSCVGVGIVVDHVALAQQPGIKRTMLLRADDPASPKYEAVMAIAEIAPGAMSAKHRHPGIEVAYVLDGSVIIEHAGKAPVTVNAGEAIENEGEAHNARNTGTKPVKILAVYLVEKGKPLSETVP
jgi:quercetin dioxygenase-like cupin family protein